MPELYESPRVRTLMAEAKAKVDNLLRSAIGSSPVGGRLYKYINGDSHRYGVLRLVGMSRAWEEEGPRNLHARIQQVLAGVNRKAYEFFLCVAGDETGISYYLGAEEEHLAALRSAVSGLLEDVKFLQPNPVLFPEAIRKRLFGGDCVGGVITGMPSLPQKEGEWLNPAYVIATGMQGRRFMMTFFCRAIPEALIGKQLGILRQEQSEAAFKTEITLQGDDVRRVSEKVVIRDYRQYSDYLDALHDHLTDSQNMGGWNVAAYYLAGNSSDAAQLSSLIRASAGGAGAGPEPVRCTPCLQAQHALDSAQMIDGDSRHPLAKCDPDSGFSSLYTTQLSSRQLACFCMLPDSEVPGFYVNDPARFDLMPRIAAHNDTITLGDVMYSPYSEKPVGSYTFSVPDLDRHALVVGTTGGGKSNTIRSLLRSLYFRGDGKKSIPFMVIESAKSEYWQLANYGIPVCALQLGSTDAPFRLNPFECAQGFPLQTHVDSLLSTFKAAFEMYPPMPFILEQSVYAVYADYGWDVATGNNSRANSQYPTLSDLYWQIPITVEQSAYDREIKNNVTGSLQTRVRSLTLGGKGRMLDCRVSSSLSSLLDTPLVLELENMGDDDNKAFVMGLLMTRLYEERRTAAAGSSVPFRHLLIIEEAHRLLKRVPTGNGEANPRAASVEFFCNMLAEIRSYGQGILIADQSPEKLAEDAVRNTNLKIVHRIVDANDRETVAGAMHMDEKQQEALSMLHRGVAAVFSEGDHRPRLVKMPLMKSSNTKSRSMVLDESRRKPVFAADSAPWRGDYDACRYCGNCRSGRCMQPMERDRCARIARGPLTEAQRRYYEDQIRQYGPDGALIWKIVEFAVIQSVTSTGGTEAQGAEQMRRMSHDAVLCVAGSTLSRLDKLEPALRALCADRLENLLIQMA